MSLNLSFNGLTLLALFSTAFIPSCIVCPSNPFNLLPSILFGLKSLLGLFLGLSMSLNLSFNELTLLALFSTAFIPSCTVFPSNPFESLFSMLLSTKSLFGLFLNSSISLNLSFKLDALFLFAFICSCKLSPPKLPGLSPFLFCISVLLPELFLSSSISLNLSFIVFKSASLSLLAFI